MQSSATAYIVAAACIGYVFCLNCHRFRFSLARKSGYYSYLYCTSFGLFFLIVGLWIDWDIFRVAGLEFPSIQIVRLENPVMRDIVSGLSVAVIALNTQNALMGKKKAAKEAWKDDLSVILNKAIQLDLPVQITLDTRKVYVGNVYDTIEPDEDSSFLSLVPLLSGHRDEDSLQLLITHRYEKIIEIWKSGNESDIEACQLVIPKSRIVTCHIFDPETYSQVREHQSD